MNEKRKLSATKKAEKRRAKAEHQKYFQWIFVNGKQIRIKRSPVIESIDEEGFIRANPDPVWLHQSGRWDVLNDIYGTPERDSDCESQKTDIDQSAREESTERKPAHNKTLDL